MKEGSLYCFVVMRSSNWNVLDCVLGVYGKLSTRRGAWACFHGLAVQKFLNIE
jgi:hypothetical protein